MISNQFANYFLASAGAGAALIGLLFVAISVRPEHILGGGAHPVRKGVASGAFTALTNAFFVSMYALIPQANVGVMAVIVGVVDVVITLRLGRELLRENVLAAGRKRRWVAVSRLAVTLGVSLTLYGYEAFSGVALLRDPHATGYVIGLTTILLGVYAVGLARSWELLGGPSSGISRWLNPLQDLQDSEDATPAPVAARPATPVASKAETPASRPASAPHFTP
ncbi:MAG TPA: hypothetical protein VJN88_02115 [Ktedonobacterales bacterium]|nr:hypothetical protein [Ktedonobacterales bacterium]